MRILREYHTIDKSRWAPGPWQSEADKVQAIDDATGLDVLLVRQPYHGSWCGYVGVPQSHPLFGQGYHDVPDVDVHGGLTFADACHETGDESRGICHVGEIGAADHVWWFGFDCAHAWDITPGHDHGFGFPDSTYRTREYVEAECARLAEQLAALNAPA
jgi:hypothetical protein